MSTQTPNQDNITLVLEAALSYDSNIRKQAENQIQLFADQDLFSLFLILSSKISSENEKTQIRQISSTTIKAILSSEKHKEKWISLSEENKKKIRDNILSTLASKIIEVRKSAALALASICKIDIPRGEWIDIFNVLSTTAQNDNLYIQLSSLKALEYIYEEISTGDIPNDKVVNLLNIYHNFLNNEKADPQLTIGALTSFKNFLPFIKDFIKENNFKLKIYDVVEKNVKNNNQNIRKCALEIFMDIAKYYYDSLEDYLEKIYNFSVQIIENDIEENKMICVEIWYTLGAEEDFRLTTNKNLKKVSKCYLQKYYKQLSNLCFKYINIIDYENEENTISKSCLALIFIMGRCCTYEFIQYMLEYIGVGLKSNEEKSKYSALKVFNAIIGTKNKEQFFSVVKDSLTMISQILFEQNSPIYFKKLSANIMSNITQEYGLEFTNDVQTFDKLIELFFNLMKISTKEILCIILISMHYLCKNVIWTEDSETNILSKHMQKLCEPLLQLCQNISLYDNENNIIRRAFFVIGVLAERAAKDVQNQMINVFKLLTEMFNKTITQQNYFQNIEIVKSYQEYITSCLSGFLPTECANINDCANLLQYVLTSFQQRNELYEEGITIIGSIALFTKDNFVQAMPSISNYLITGLRSFDSPQICRASIFALSDIIRGLENNFNKFVNDFIPLAMNILCKDDIERKIKPQCFNILSDLFLYCPDEAFKLFNNVMKIIGEAIQLTQIKFDEDSDIDNVQYFTELREHILETLTAIFCSVQEKNKVQDFVPYVKPIITYIFNITSDSCAFSIEICKEGLFLIADFCKAYTHDIAPILNLDVIKYMCEKIESDPNEKNNEDTMKCLDWAKKEVNKAFQG